MLANGLFYSTIFPLVQYYPSTRYLRLQSGISGAVSFEDFGGSTSVISFDTFSTTYDFQMLPAHISHLLLPEANL